MAPDSFRVGQTCRPWCSVRGEPVRSMTICRRVTRSPPPALFTVPALER